MMRANQYERLRLALRDLACVIGSLVIALVIVLTPLAVVVGLIHLAVQRWG